ncbi:hypothetical protein [Myxococcus xanthus]|uniref:Uncharacterized protein n=1 Tax=Myxococcus xanthus TaxID=34 RepID=A0A7Y4MS71_MYXXA|nr:hypothetical protein [Myxococcus xanthus]NOJ80220.1 hypothetical protein [Myxococcus xanthus]NOJ86303.1 hypothetical protein [Myxococcus xanthus]
MTDKKDLKKLVRERKAETGESNTTALRHERNGGNFRSLVEATIRLAAARREEEHRMAPPTGGIISGSELARRMRERMDRQIPRPAHDAFVEHIAKLDRSTIVSLVTLHSLGREHEPTDGTIKVLLASHRAHMSREESRVTGMNKLMERTSIDRDLMNGLNAASHLGFDIEDLPFTK